MALSTLAALSLAAGTYGCSSQNTSAAPARSAAVPSGQAPGWTREAVEQQQRFGELQARMSTDARAASGTTPWRVVELANIGATLAPATTPGRLLIAMIAARGWADSLGDALHEETIRIWSDSDDASLGVILLWDFTDDAVAGHDFRVSMRLTPNGWTAERVEERYHCRRRITAQAVCG
jgi:hypothetical protein